VSTEEFNPRDITEELFSLWRIHPATKAFMTYLADYAEALERGHIDRWKRGETDPDYEAESRGRVLTITEIIDLRHEHLVAFYQNESNEMDTDEGQSNSE
jgi:hypothetical protein